MIGDSLKYEINLYLFVTAVILFSDFEISKSENKTLLAKKINVINITMRLRFFMVSRFGLANILNIYLTTKRIKTKSLNSM